MLSDYYAKWNKLDEMQQLIYVEKLQTQRNLLYETLRNLNESCDSCSDWTGIILDRCNEIQAALDAIEPKQEPRHDVA